MLLAHTILRSLYLVCCLTLIVHINAMAAVEQQETQDESGAEYELEPFIEGLPQSWGLAVSPKNELFITHRNGGLSKVTFSESIQGEATVTSTVNIDFKPEDLLTGGQGGLLDIILHPDYLENDWIYVSYSAGSADKNGLKIVRFTLNENGVEGLQTIFELANHKDTPVHYGARMAFDKTKALLVTSGDGFDYREKAQVISNQLGKTLRMSDEGDALADNPFYSEEASPANYVYSIGHRNPQALLRTPSGQVLSNEHGPDGGDEINIISNKFSLSL